MSRATLTLIILNYNSQFWLKKTLTSLKINYLDKSKTKVKTIVVDNNSQDDSVKMVKKEFPWIELIELDNNSGYAAGNNVALKAVDSEYVMLLNNDVEFTAGSNLDLLIEFLKQHQQFAVASPKVFLSNGKLDWACHRGEPTPWASFTYFLGLAELFPQSKLFARYHQTYQNMNNSHTIDACTGAAMMIRTKYMNEVGLLDELFFMYAEDLDWCKRFRDAGYKISFVPLTSIIHHKYKSGIKTQTEITALQAKKSFYNTMLQYYDKHYQSKYPKIIRWLLKTFLFIKKGGM